MAVSSSSLSPRQARCRAGSSRRSPTCSSARPLRRRAPRERPQPREQLAEGERLDQVVVGARVEPLDPVLDRVAGGQHQHRRPDAARAKLAAGRKAVDAGKHHVEHDHVVGRGGAIHSAVLAGRGEIGRMTLLAEAANKQLTEPRLVFDHQDAHLIRLSSRQMNGA